MKGNKKTVNLVVTVIIIIAVAVYVYLFIFQKNSKIVVTPEITKSNITRGDSYLLSEPKSKDNVQVALPDSLLSLVIPESKDSNIVSATYPEGAAGYVVELKGTGYSLQSTINYYVKFGQKPGWKVQKGSFGVGYGIVNLENYQYKVQAETIDTKGEYPVTIKIIIK